MGFNMPLGALILLLNIQSIHPLSDITLPIKIEWRHNGTVWYLKQIKSTAHYTITMICLNRNL